MAKAGRDAADNDRQRQAIQAFMRARNLSINGWTTRAGISESGLRTFLKGPGKSLGMRSLNKLAAAESVPVSVLLGEEKAELALLETPPGMALIPEILAHAGMGDGGLPEIETFGGDTVRENWGLPKDYIRGDLRSEPEELRIMDLKGDSMEPTLYSTDKAIINIADRVPSPPGIFAIWDGYAIIVKRVEIIPKSKPLMLRIISDNPLHRPYEIEAEEHTIQGRLRGVIRRL